MMIPDEIPVEILETFKKVEFSFYGFRSSTGVLALHAAVRSDRLDMCIRVCNIWPSLLYQRDKAGKTPIHFAAEIGSNKIVSYFICHEEAIRGSCENILKMTDFKGRIALHHAVRKGNRDAAMLLLGFDDNRKQLEMFNGNGDTPMHLAVKGHKLEMVKLFLEMKPEFVYGHNESDADPYEIAFVEAVGGDQICVEIRNLLLSASPSHCKVPEKSSGWTMLHRAASYDDISAVEFIVQLCPECMELVDNNGRNFVHVAVLFEQLIVVKHILTRNPKLHSEIFNIQDNNGDTPLHIAAAEGHDGIILSLLYDFRVNKMIVNKQGQRALDKITIDYDKRKAGVYGLLDVVNKKEINERTNFDLLVGALIATASFATGVTVPGGSFSDGPNKGTALLATYVSFKVFVVSNTTALLLSLYAIICHFCVKRLHKREYVVRQLSLAMNCLLGSIFAMVLAFTTGSWAVLTPDGFAIIVCVLCSCFFVFAFHTIWRVLAQ